MLSIGCQSGDQSTNQTSTDSEDQSTNTIVTTSYPLEWLTKQIVGDQYTVNFPAGDSDHPSRWRPNRETIAEIQAADLIICNGIAAPYANWMKTVSLPSSKVVESASQGLSLADFIAVTDIQIVHSHGPEGEHSHPTMVSRTWLDPAKLIKQANYITQQLCKQRPDDAPYFKANLAKVTAELKAIVRSVKPAPSVSVYSATPELKFLTRAAGVDDLHFNWNENTTLAQAKTDLVKTSPAAPPEFILLPQRLQALAERLQPLLQEQELKPVFIDTLDRATDDNVIQRSKENFVKMTALTSK